MMRLKNIGSGIQIALVIALGVLLVAAVGAYAWDASNEDEIAEGVSIGGIDVGGDDANEARVVVRKEIVDPLKQPVHVSVEKERYTLTPEELGVRADIDGMVDEAVSASREGGIFSRVWRYASGADVDTDVEPRIDYDDDALQGFVDGVAGKVDREPQDATVEPTPTDLTPVPEQAGVAVQTDELRDRVEGALQSPQARVVKAPVEKVQPEVTTDELTSEYPAYMTIDRDNFMLRYFENLKLKKEYTIAVGAVGYDTPAGLYHIQNKAVNPSWTVPDSDWTGDLAGQVVPPGPENPLKARWMGIFDGAGIHGTDDIGSLGTAASHGCIRMAVPDVVELYDQVGVGTPTYIF
ncbi:MAG TPA: L,D-transpeptidase/peptidoglycan binding protein [Solirubrobacterales bacterium]|nr:L,D-transpeptidase/peptidoglycan binding protein [Solirubrobacterales bacterium]